MAVTLHTAVGNILCACLQRCKGRQPSTKRDPATMRAKYYTEEDVLRQQLAHAQAEIMVRCLILGRTQYKQHLTLGKQDWDAAVSVHCAMCCCRPCVLCGTCLPELQHKTFNIGNRCSLLSDL